MIFDNTLTEQQMVENFIKEGGEGKGFIFKSYYDEENNKIILSNLYYDENNIMHEENIDQRNLGIPLWKKKSMPRYIMITGSDESSHGGRMKVSLNGEYINKKNKINYISIYRKNNNSITYEGDFKNIKITIKEYELYEKLFLRNEDLIWSIYFNRGMFGKYPDKAFINDEDRRRKGMIVIRDRYTGNAKIYDKNNNLIRVENIKGEII